MSTRTPPAATRADAEDHTSARRLAVHRLARKPTSAARADTQRRLIDAGRHVIAENGVGGSSVGLITSAAGFSRGAFYSNFTDMDHFVQQVAQREWDSILDSIGRTLREATSSGTPAPLPQQAHDEGGAALVDGGNRRADAAAAPDGAPADVATTVAASLMESTGPLLDAAPRAGTAVPESVGDQPLTPDYVGQLSVFARALLAAVPRDREFHLLWASLANFMVRYPEDSTNLRQSFADFRRGMAQYVVEALDRLDLEPRIDPLDLVDLVIAIGTRSTRAALVDVDQGRGELIDRVLPQLLPMLARPTAHHGTRVD